MTLLKCMLIAVFCITLISSSGTFAAKAMNDGMASGPVLMGRNAASGFSPSGYASSLSRQHGRIAHPHVEALTGVTTRNNGSRHESIIASATGRSAARAPSKKDFSMMLLAGVGLVVLQLRRKQKSLHQRSLVS